MLKPLLDKILIKEDKETEKKMGALLMPGTAGKKSHSIGTVMAVGAGMHQEGTFVPNCVEIGDRVLYMKYSANCYRDEENELVLIRNSDLLGKLDE